MELYKTVRSEAEATQIIERSKFIAHVRPAETRQEAEDFIAAVRRRYRDASHNVPAMVLGDKFQIQWASDDGEPQGTSGAPIVQMLVKENLTNLVVVVTRYFGGIKLGTGGLVRAYTGSAKLGIEAAGVCSVREVWAMDVRVDYSHLAKLQNMASQSLQDAASPNLQRKEPQGLRKPDAAPEEGAGFTIGQIQYSDKVQMQVFSLPEDREETQRLFSNVTSGTAEVLGEAILQEKV